MVGHVPDVSASSNPAIGQDWAERAHDALEAAQKLPVGAERTAALRMADMLRDAFKDVFVGDNKGEGGSK